MADALDLLETLKDLDIRQVCIDTATDAEEEMVRANEDQLSKGIRADGSEIEPPYTPFTVLEKAKKSGLSSVSDHVTLFDTGAHYEGLFAKVEGINIEFGSRDKKSEALQKKYGKIYGLDEQSKEGVIEEFMEPRFQGKVERATGLKFE